jgi:hypothetical protein
MGEENVIEIGKPFMCFLYKDHAHAGSFFISLTPLQNTSNIRESFGFCEGCYNRFIEIKNKLKNAYDEMVVDGGYSDEVLQEFYSAWENFTEKVFSFRHQLLYSQQITLEYGDANKIVEVVEEGKNSFSFEVARAIQEFFGKHFNSCTAQEIDWEKVYFEQDFQIKYFITG